MTIFRNNVALTNKQIKAEIQKMTGWSTEEYNKQYDITRNKLRNYERYGNKEKQPVNEFLFYKIRSEKRGYEKSEEMKLIEKTPSISTGKAAVEYFSNERKIKTYEKWYNEATGSAFSEFIKASPQAREIVEQISDPLKRERALSILAKKMHLQKARDKKYYANQAIPYGQVLGSPDYVRDFDIKAFLAGQYDDEDLKEYLE